MWITESCAGGWSFTRNKEKERAARSLPATEHIVLRHFGRKPLPGFGRRAAYRPARENREWVDRSGRRHVTLLNQRDGLGQV